ncbi:ATP phosphoribosyltransferase regulatory subunit, partial [Streptococcus suis]
GVTNYTFEFSHAKILQHLFTTLQLDEVKTSELKNLIANKNITGLYGFTVDNPSPFDAFIRELSYLFGKGD